MIVAPSILSIDFNDFEKQIEILNNKCDYIHFDVMDGHFVPNISFGPDILKTIRKNSDSLLDVHLMVTNPEFISTLFIKAGGDLITFHHEVYNDPDKCKELIDLIKSYNVKVGISIKPKTDVKVLNPLLPYVDLVLIMSVEPGFGGQEFLEDSYNKVSYLDIYRKQNNLKYLIEIDGGISDKNIYKLKDCGLDICVAGSYIFKGDIEKNIDSLNV